MNHQPNTPASINEAVAQCPTCKAPCTTTVKMRGGDHGWGTTDAERTVYRYAAPGAAIDAREQDLIKALASAHAKLIYAGADSARLDWLDVTNERFRMGWGVGCAPAGNVSVESIIMGGKSIREAIDAAMPTDALASRQEAQPASEPFQKALEIRIAQGFQLGGNACPILYTDSINGEQVGRDDLWIATTAGLKGSDATPSEALSPATVAQPVALTDAELGAVAYKGFDDYWTEDSPGREREAWTASAKAVLKAAQPCASQGCGDAEIDCAVDVYSSRMCERGTKGCAARHAALSKK